MSKWDDVALPLLQWIGNHEGLAARATMGELAGHVGAEVEAVVLELDRLIQAGYVSAPLRKNMGPAEGWGIGPPLSLGELGARAVGMWPGNDAGEVLLRVLSQAEEAEQDPERRSRLHRAREALGGLAKDFVTELGVSIVKGAAGLP